MNPATGTYSPEPLYDRRPVATKHTTASYPTADEAARVAEFRVALRRFQHQTEVVARDCGITPGWYLLLLQIKGAPDLTEQTTVTALADRLQLAQSSVTELVSRAQQAGLVERTPSSDDARVVYLRLSREGEQVFARAFRSLTSEREALREAIAHLED
jgi:DNA-binding MarR family transcriptional regulator